MTKIAIVRVKGEINVSGEINDTMKILRLYKLNYAIILEKNTETMGMVKKVKDFVVWGEIDDETAKKYAGKKFIRLQHTKGIRKYGKINEKIISLLERKN